MPANSKLDSEFEQFLSEQASVRAVIDDDRAFRSIINIGDDAYSSLKAATVVGKFLATAGAGTAGGMAVSAAHFAGLGLWGKALLLVGLGSHPVGWVIAGGAATAALVYGGWTAYEKIRDSAYEPPVPKFLRHGVDVLGDSLAHVVTPFAIHIAKADGTITDDEIAVIRNVFTGQWGYNEDYIAGVIDLHRKRAKLFRVGRAVDGLHSCLLYTSDAADDM
jgi:hypothetical protein